MANYGLPEPLKSRLIEQAKLGSIIVIEIERDGKKYFLKSASMWAGDEAIVEDPRDAKNYALDNGLADGTGMGKLWYDVNVLYVKDQGGGKSAVRTDIPGKIVVFDPPPPSPPLARLGEFKPADFWPKQEN